jgi:hypothetical protein
MDYDRFYKKLFQPIEERVGPMDQEGIGAIIGFDCGGPIRLDCVGHGRGPFVTYVTAELAWRPEQKPAEFGRYEIMMTCDDEDWARKVLTRMGGMSTDVVFGHGHTVDIQPLVGAKPPIQGVAIEEFARVQIDGQSYGLLQIHGITRSEMEYARKYSTDMLLEQLKHANIYPRTSSKRKRSVFDTTGKSMFSRAALWLDSWRGSRRKSE